LYRVVLAAAFVLGSAALSAAAARPASAPPAQVAKPPLWRSAIVRRSVPLRVRPSGRVVARAGTSTEFGSAHAYSLHADLSGRWLELRRGARTIRRITVAIGRPGSETPTGRFAVTDKLRGGNYGPYYGCCILALNGHQPKLPAGWQGGNRLAIHGTNAPGTIGAPASAGCLRAADSDLRLLMRRVPLGAPVFIRN
jgi:lipoprotein-anchoring transpeptidase ErfK/SrfK